MRFELDAEQSMLTEQIREFARHEIHVESETEGQESPLSSLQMLAEMGLLGITLGEEAGGVGVDRIAFGRLLSELAYTSGSLATLVMHANVLVNEHLERFGSQAQKDEWLPAFATGERLVAWAGSARLLDTDDTSGLKATKTGEGWLLDGSVSQVLLGADATDVLLFATDEEGRRHVFLVDGGRDGLHREVEKGVLGLRGAQPSVLHCQKLAVTVADRIGQMESAQEEINEIFGFARIAAAALLNGVAQAAFEASSDYAKERQQFGKPIAAFQAIQWKVAEMAMGLEAARLLVDESAEAWELSDSKQAAHLGNGAFNFAADKALSTGTEAIQIHGGYGYTTEFPVERFYRDILTLRARWER
jgi:alkylation response protein AidB-like acyl-CoA dehydrogenase